MTLEQFEQRLSQAGVVLNNEQKEQFEKYCLFLQEYNEKVNLTAITQTEEIYEKHFCDCALALCEEVKGKVLDVGSGAGFPGVVWKILKPEVQMVLLEPTGKRVRFLDELITLLNLKGIRTVNQRAEDYVRKQRESFDAVSARAVASLPVLCELCLPLVRPDGYFIAMKSEKAEEEIRQASRALKILNGEILRIDSPDLNGQTRNNIIIRKNGKTDAKYPRPYSQIKRKPL